MSSVSVMACSVAGVVVGSVAGVRSGWTEMLLLVMEKGKWVYEENGEKKKESREKKKGKRKMG